MRLLAALALLLPSAVLAEPAAPVTRVEVFATHEFGRGGVREERLRVAAGKDGPILTLTIRTDGSATVYPSVAVPADAWIGLKTLVATYGLATWNLPPGVAHDWGQQGYEVAAKDVTSRSWTGPFPGWAPPLSLHRRMAELAHLLLPKQTLEFFPAKRGPADRRIRTWSLAGGLVFPPEHGGPMFEVELEVWGDVRTMTVRRNSAKGMKETVSEVTAGDWDRLWALATDPEVAAWDPEKVFPIIDHGGGGLEVAEKGVAVLLQWGPGMPPPGSAPEKLLEGIWKLPGVK
ncbi:MAG: hypothetical protein HUU15_15920 [Candidatus Brocadiae bacterium]|nr:hypothetical protein [Candidatus Brocadiia bacterium]